MNDTPTGSAPQADKQAKVKAGMQLLERIESSFDKLHDLWGEGHAAGMLDITECHELQNITLALKYQTLALHCRGTAVAKRNKCDVGKGDFVALGGPGR